jgi:hypothetical protein
VEHSQKGFLGFPPLGLGLGLLPYTLVLPVLSSLSLRKERRKEKSVSPSPLNHFAFFGVFWRKKKLDLIRSNK